MGKNEILREKKTHRKPVGTWFGPNTVAQVLRKLCLYDPRYVT